jgi:hypothetical protein
LVVCKNHSGSRSKPATTPTPFSRGGTSGFFRGSPAGQTRMAAAKRSGWCESARSVPQPPPDMPVM